MRKNHLASFCAYLFTTMIMLGLGAGCIKYSAQGTLPAFLAATDQFNNRVLIYQSPYAGNAPAANLILGQPDAVSSSANNGGAATGMNGPKAVCFDAGHVFVSDTSNHRILIWNSIPYYNQQPPDLVIGQPNLSTVTPNTGGISASTLNSPSGVACGGGKLVVSDTSNLRVLIWNSYPTINGQAADLVLGSLTMNSAGAAATTASSTWEPTQVSYSNGRLFLADDINRRISIWNNFPTYNNQAADLVLGQPDFTHNATNDTPGAPGTVSAQSLNPQLSVCSNGSQLVVGDNNNSRILIWNTIPIYNQQPADLVLGQPDFTHSTYNNTPGSPGTLSAQAIGGGGLIGLACDVRSLTASDKGNERILVWKTFPTINQQSADVVIGEPSMSSNAWQYTTTATSFSGVWGISSNFMLSGVARTGGY